MSKVMRRKNKVRGPSPSCRNHSGVLATANGLCANCNFYKAQGKSLADRAKGASATELEAPQSKRPERTPVRRT